MFLLRIENPLIVRSKDWKVSKKSSVLKLDKENLNCYQKLKRQPIFLLNPKMWHPLENKLYDKESLWPVYVWRDKMGKLKCFNTKIVKGKYFNWNQGSKSMKPWKLYQMLKICHSWLVWSRVFCRLSCKELKIKKHRCSYKNNFKSK